MSDFAVYIPSFKRANNQMTFHKLRDMGYSGDMFILVGEDDPQLTEYRERYGDSIVVFDKQDYVNEVDLMINRKTLGTVVYARNAILDIARVEGHRYILMIDDDMTELQYFQTEREITEGFDEQVAMVMEFMKSSGAEVVTYGYPEDSEKHYGSWQRPRYQGFYIDLESDLTFQGISANDEIYYLRRRRTGKVMTALEDIIIHTPKRGSNQGGLHELYQESESYHISFYPVLEDPVSSLINYDKYDHEFYTTIDRNYPRILGEDWRKSNA